MRKPAGWAPEVRHELQHWLSVVSLVSQGLGVALVPAALQQSKLAGACFVPIDDLHATYDTHCLWRSDRDQQALTAQPAIAIADLFETGDFQALPLFDGLHERAGFHQ